MRPALLLALLLSVPARAEDLKVVAASVDITPPLGTPMAGYYAERAAEGVHDPLHAKAIVLERDGKTVVLVGLDLIATTFGIVAEARRMIEETTGIEGADVMISATHAHTGPILQGKGDRIHPFGGRNPLTVKYGQRLPGMIAEAVRKAEANLRPARVSAVHGHEPSICFNRRFHMTDGTVGWNPGKLNPKILKPAGPIDPDVAVVYFESDDEEKAPLATYVNYSVHLDNVGGTKFSADLPATVSDLLGRFKGPDMVTLYTAGCCGDVNHIDVNWAAPQGGHANAARMGVILAGEVLRAWPRLKADPSGGLRVRTARVRLPLPEITAEDIASARAVVGAWRTSPGRSRSSNRSRRSRCWMSRPARASRMRSRSRSSPWATAMPGSPCRGRSSWSWAWRSSRTRRSSIRSSPNWPTGSSATSPRCAYAQGNYEVVSARCAEGSGEMLVDAAVEMLKELHLEASRDGAK